MPQSNTQLFRQIPTIELSKIIAEKTPGKYMNCEPQTAFVNLSETAWDLGLWTWLWRCLPSISPKKVPKLSAL